MKPSLKKFDRICNNLFSEQVTATMNGQSLDVTDDGKGNIQITGEMPEDTDQIADQQIQQYISINDKINNILNFLQSELSENVQAARAAKIYSLHAGTDLPQVKYNQGYAEGKKHIIKYLIKQLSGLIENEQ